MNWLWINNLEPAHMAALAVAVYLTVGLFRSNKTPIEECPYCKEQTIFKDRICIMCGTKKPLIRK